MTNRDFIERIINLRKEKDDNVKAFAIRCCCSQKDVFTEYQPFNKEIFNSDVYTKRIDGLRLKFKNITLTISERT